MIPVIVTEMFAPVPELNASDNFFKPAPAIIGPESMKANFAAFALVCPRNKPAEIVAPDREIPGIKAKD